MTKKEQRTAAQEAVNAIVKEAFRDALTEKIINSRRLRSCNAVVHETKSFYILQSYRTVTGLICKEDGRAFDRLRTAYGYTATSSQHFSKFMDDYNGDHGKLYRSNYVA